MLYTRKLKYYLKTDKTAIGVQKRVLKIINGYNNLNYDKRLNTTGLLSLGQRHVREDFNSYV